jgi:small membrane protein
MIIKLVLLLALLGVGFYASRTRTGAGHLALRRLVGVMTLGAGAVAVISPTLVTRVANAVGVGRGTDLLLYAFVVASLVVWLSIYRRFDEMERRFAAMARQLAIREAELAQPMSADD